MWAIRGDACAFGVDGRQTKTIAKIYVISTLLNARALEARDVIYGRNWKLAGTVSANAASYNPTTQAAPYNALQ